MSQLYSPGGRLVKTFDTQTTPVARVTVARRDAPDEWEGFWCLSIGKAPRGAFDDVYVALDASLPPWFTLNPAEPVTITALPKAQEGC